MTKWVCAAAFALTLASCDDVPEARQGPEAPVVNLYIWSNYMDPTVVPEFTKRTGLKVNVDYLDSNDVLEGRLLSGSTGYDIVTPSNNFFEPQRIAGVFQKLDKSLIPNYKNLTPQIIEQLKKVDPTLEYGVPYLWGSTAMAYDLDKVKARIPNPPLDSWALLFDPKYASKLADCGIAILDQSDEVLYIAMKYLGMDPEVRTKTTVPKALAVVNGIRPYVRYFHSSQYIDDFANGEVCIVLGWTGDFYQAMQSAKPGLNLTYVIPTEGSNMWFDIMAVPADAPHPKNAMKLINYLLEGEVAAKDTNFVGYPSPNSAAMPFLRPDIRDNPRVYPPEEVMARLAIDKNAAPKIVRLRNRIWTAIKTGQFKENEGR